MQPKHSGYPTKQPGFFSSNQVGFNMSGTGRLNKDIYAKQSSKSGIVFHQGDVLYGKLRPYLQNWLLPTFDGLAVGDFWVLQPQNADSSFLYRLIQSRQFDEVANQSTGTKMPRADWKLVSKTVFSIPSNISEQAAIGTYFTALDSLITLHQRKCALLFSPFQAFISMMFITSTFSWEQRKLGDIADIVGGGTPSTGNQSYWDGDIDWYAPAEIADQIYANSSQKKITGLGYENSSAKMLPPGTVLFTSRAGIGKTAILTRKGCTNQGFQSIVPHRGELDSYFIFSRTEELKRYGELVGAGSTFVEVSGKQMAVMELMMPPTMREQQTIGGFFQQLDHLITLHQRQPFLQSPPDISLIVQLTPPFYTFSWEQREVGDLLIERSQQAPMSDEYPLMAFIANEGVAPKGERYDRSALVTDTVNKLYKKTEKGDFIYSSNNLETGSIGLNKYGKACISPVYSIFEPTGIADSDFLGRRLVRKDFINAMVKWRQGVIYGQWRIHESDFLKIEISVPSVEEQRKIGAYLDQLDNLITLHQRKFEKLTNVKKSMLEKMFPQNGSSYPEIRFKGFTDPWEQRKLSEITDKVTEKNAGLQYVETFTNSAEFGIISQRDFFDHDIAKLGSLDGYYIVKTEDFVYNPRISTSAPVGPINRNKLGRTGVMSPLYTVFRPHDIDTTYLEYFFKCGYWHSFMNFNGDSGARSDRFSIRDNVFFQMPIPIPDIDEQRKIGELLTCLDNLITLHQRQTIVYAVIRSIRKVILAERQYFAPPMVRKSP